MKGVRVTIKPLVDAMARIPAVMLNPPLMVFRAPHYVVGGGMGAPHIPKHAFGGWDASIQRFVVALPRLT